jgi:hypothetical protein
MLLLSLALSPTKVFLRTMMAMVDRHCCMRGKTSTARQCELAAEPLDVAIVEEFRYPARFGPLVLGPVSPKCS